MLKKRIFTAAILIPIVLLILFFAPAWLFVLVTSVMILVAAWEWANLMGMVRWQQQAFYITLTTFTMIVSYYIPLLWCLWLACFWWIFAFFFVLNYPRNIFYWQTNSIIQGIMGLLILVLCWRTLNVYMLTLPGRWQLFTLLILIWGADIAAYFAGHQWGKHKLAVAVSPGKTWQGFMAAIVFAFLFSLLYAVVQAKAIFWHWLAIICMFISTTIISVIGDLTESMLKRNASVKDSSQLLPGHGGLLDRIDSLLAAAPIFMLWLSYLKLYVLPHGGLA